MPDEIDASRDLDDQHESEHGASLVEYALLVGLIALVALVAVQFFGDQNSSAFTSFGVSMANAH